MTNKKLGRPPAGGPRINVRFNNDSQLEQLEKKVKSINKKAKFGATITRNSFIVDAVMEALKKIRL